MRRVTRVAVVLCVLALVAVAVAWLYRRWTLTVNAPKAVSVSMPDYTLDVENPCDFLQLHLAGVFGPGPSKGDSIDGDNTVRISRGEDRLDLKVMLISGYDMGEGKYYVRLIGRAASLEDSCETARRTCRVVGIPNDKIDQWQRTRDRSSLKSACLQTGTSGDGVQHSVTIRNALSGNASAPLAVDYTVYAKCIP